MTSKNVLAGILALLAGCAYPHYYESGPSTDSPVSTALAHTRDLDNCTGVEVARHVVVTAKHCLEDGAEVNSNYGRGGVVYYISPTDDFTVIVYPGTAMSVGATQIYMRDYNIAEHVYVVGYPVQLTDMNSALTVTDGIMAGPVSTDGKARLTAPAYFGNSGGGVWADDGALVGIAVSIMAAPQDFSPAVPYPAMTYMVPISRIRNHLP